MRQQVRVVLRAHFPRRVLLQRLSGGVALLYGLWVMLPFGHPELAFWVKFLGLLCLVGGILLLALPTGFFTGLLEEQPHPSDLDRMAGDLDDLREARRGAKTGMKRDRRT